MYMFQRIGDAGRASAVAVTGFGSALINMQNAINRMHEKQAELTRLYAPTEPYDMAGLGRSILKEDHGRD